MRHTVRDIPDNIKKEIISRWLNGEYRDKISSEMRLPTAQVTSVISEWKREIGSAIAEAYRGITNSGLTSQEPANPADVIQAFKLMLSLKKFGVEPQKFDDYVSRFSKIAISAGVEAEGLASLVNQILKLAELDGIEIHQLPAHLEGLQISKKELELEIEKLRETRDSLEQSALQPSETGSAQQPPFDKKLFSQFVGMSEQIKQFGLSIDDFSSFAEMMSNAKKFGYDFASIIDFVSSLGTLEQQKNRVKIELERLTRDKDSMQERHRALEKELSSKQEILNSFAGLTQMGLDQNDLELINEVIHKAADVNEIEELSIAKKKFVEDIKKLYSNNNNVLTQPVGMRLPVEEQEPEQRSEYDKDLLNLVERLTAKGITEQVLLKCLIINEIFKLDLDTLADDLKKYSNLRIALKRLENRRSRIESEELLLKHKILALEERQMQVATELKESISKAQDISRQFGHQQELDLAPLMRIAKGEKPDAIDQHELNRAILDAIDLVSRGLDPASLTKKILDHAKFSLQHEQPNTPPNNSV